MPDLSKDALILALGFLRGPRSKLSFGGEGAENKITERGRTALTELINAGYVETAKVDDQIVGREHYRGVEKEPHIGALAQAAKIDPFGEEMRWAVFEKIESPDEEPDALSF